MPKTVIIMNNYNYKQKAYILLNIKQALTLVFCKQCAANYKNNYIFYLSLYYKHILNFNHYSEKSIWTFMIP